jgi:hypothetical protein
MKTNSTFSLVTLALAAVLAPMHLAAQSATLTVNVPFNFTMGAKALPAADYRVRISGDVVYLDTEAGDAHMVSVGIALGMDGKYVQPKLVFKQYGDRFVLSQVWNGGDRGNELRKSAIERELSAKNERPTPVAVLASRR